MLEPTFSLERAMLGPTEPLRLDQPIAVSLEDLVPQDNFYRHLVAKLDLSFVRDWVPELYAERDRPSMAHSWQSGQLVQWTQYSGLGLQTVHVAREEGCLPDVLDANEPCHQPHHTLTAQSSTVAPRLTP